MLKLPAHHNALKKLPTYEEALKLGKCKACQEGRLEDCTADKKTAKAFIEGPDGKKKYFCNLGCILLQLNQKGRAQLFEGEVGPQGHYEKTIGSMYSTRERLGYAKRV